jgi:Transposase IS116/IS110/IS902 family
MRDLVRARATAGRVLAQARQHLQGFLLRHERIYRGPRAWTLAYRRWLTTVRFDHPAPQIVLQDYIHAVEDAEARRDRLTRQIEELLPSWSMAPVVKALQARRGVAVVVAVTVVAEVGDFRRFANARQLRAYLGLVPSEHSSGNTIRRGGITKAGNAQARRVLIEGAWTYRMNARVSRKLDDRLEPLSAAIRGHCVESAGPTVCAISPIGRLRQAEGRGHHRDRPRDGRLHLGDRPRRPAGSRLTGLATCTRSTLDRAAASRRCPSGGTRALSDGATGYLKRSRTAGPKKPCGFAAALGRRFASPTTPQGQRQ